MATSVQLIEINKRGKMAIKEEHLRTMIMDILTPLDWYSEDAEELLMMTMAVETHLGEYLTQEGGPAEGIFQMEPDTERDIHENFLQYREETANKVYSHMSMMGEDLKYNLPYQVILARVHYLRVHKPIPDKGNTEALAEYWKQYWNTEEGKGTVTKAMEKYDYYVE